jgi:CRP/FNR family transcriptional regulator
MTVDEILRSFDFYRSAPPDRRAAYAADVSLASFTQGATFYIEGDKCSHVALIGRGDVRVFKQALGGREITLYHVRDGEPCLINMLSVFLDRPATASAITEAPTSAVIVPAAVVRRWIGTDDHVRAYVFETMAARMMEVMTLTVEVSVSRMDARLASLLLRLVDLQGEPVIRMTHDDLAAELGTAREVVSRLLKEFERAGALRLSRAQVTIVDRSILAELGESPRGNFRTFGDE